MLFPPTDASLLAMIPHPLCFLSGTPSLAEISLFLQQSHNKGPTNPNIQLFGCVWLDTPTHTFSNIIAVSFRQP